MSANAFQTGFNSGYTLAQIQKAVLPASFSAPSISSFPSTFHSPHTVEWSFEIQQELDAHNMLTASYVGNHAYDLQEAVNANMFASSTSIKNYGVAYGGLPSAAPDGRFVTVSQIYNNGISNYDALTIQYRHMFTYGLSAQLHYTWSHALGDVIVGSSTASYVKSVSILTPATGVSASTAGRHQMAADILCS